MIIAYPKAIPDSTSCRAIITMRLMKMQYFLCKIILCLFWLSIWDCFLLHNAHCFYTTYDGGACPWDYFKESKYVVCTLADSGFFKTLCIKVAWSLQFLGYLRTLSLKGEMHKKAYEHIWLLFFQFLTDFHEISAKAWFRTFWNLTKFQLF